MNRSIAHEGTGRDKFIFDIHVYLVHVFVHMFAAHVLYNTSGLCIWPPVDSKEHDRPFIIQFHTENTITGVHIHLTLFVLAHSDLASRQEFNSQNGGDTAHAQGLASFVESLN